MIHEKPTVFVLDDDFSMRRALDRLLSAKGWQVVSFSTAEDFLKLKVNPQVACLLLDVNLPGLSGLDLQVLLSQRKVELPIVFISGHGDIPMAVHAIKAGAVNFLTKPFGEAQLIGAIEHAFAVCRDRLKKNSEVEELQQCYARLTKRECEVLLHVVHGKLNKETASELGIVENTVKVHRRRVMNKMRARSVAELVVMFQKLNLPIQSPRPRAS